jgi:hypothetical protein
MRPTPTSSARGGAMVANATASDAATRDAASIGRSTPGHMRLSPSNLGSVLSYTRDSIKTRIDSLKAKRRRGANPDVARIKERDALIKERAELKTISADLLQFCSRDKFFDIVGSERAESLSRAFLNLFSNCRFGPLTSATLESAATKCVRSLR